MLFRSSRAMKERGRYQIQCLKSRSSTGVDQKIDLEYNIETMRITDPGLDTDTSHGPPNVSAIMNKIKNAGASNTDDSDDVPKSNFTKPTGTPAWEKGEVKASGITQSAVLKNMLNSLKKSD